jgi:hypothetical protein
MTARTAFERLRHRIQVDDVMEFSRCTGLSLFRLRQILSGDYDSRDVKIGFLKNIADASETPIGLLVEWWYEPEEEGLKAAAFAASLNRRAL